MREHSAGYLIPSIEGLLPTKLLATRVTVNQQEVAGMVQAMQESSFVGFDLETWAPEQPAFMQAARGREYVDVLSSKIVGAGFTFGKHMEQTVYFSFDHAETSNLNLKLLDWILENIKKPLIIANVPFERTVIKNTRDIQLDDVIDIQPMISHWDENSEQGLKYSSSRILQYKQTEYRDVVAKGKTMRDYSAFHVFDYGADDPLCTVHIYQYLQTMLEIESTHEFVSAFEQPTLLQFSDAFLDGVTIDVEELERQKAEDEARLDVLMQEMRDLIKLNQTEEQIKAGADNLFSEAAAVLLAKQQQKAEREVDSDAESEPERHYSVMEEDELEPVLVEHHEPLLLEDSDERLQANLAKLHIDLISKVRYQDYRKVPKEHRFDITPGKLPDICGAFGLPPLADLKPATITDYLHEHAGKGTFVQDQFLAALHKCAQAKEFSPAKRGVAYQELRDFCYLYWFATLPEEKKFTWEGFEFNLGSPKQKELLLYGMLVLPYRLYNPKVSKTRKALGLGGAPQTDKDAIADAIANVVAPEGDWRREVLMRLTEAQRCYTRLSLFYATLPLWVHPSTGNIHPGFRSCGTKTRRPSGSSPNLLQMPKRGDGVKIRKAILPNKRKGHNIVVSLDFVQEELMLLAGLSRDPNLFSCYSGEVVKDVHSMTTAPFAGMVLEQFEVARQTDKRLNDMRVNQGKATNFLSVYGGGAAKLSRKILRPQSEAKQWLEGFDQTYPGIRVWKERQIALLRQQGYLEDLLGARTHVYDRCKGRDESYRGSVDRQAISSQIQGLAAGIAKRVLSKLWEWKTFQRTGSTFYALVYDELVASLHHTQAITVISEMHAAMTMLVEGLGLPMRADISLGPSWGEQIECGREVNEERINAAIEKVLAK
jgi:DNA polymerase I-like protein with 3'-5' exonuclease and polymerase domains